MKEKPAFYFDWDEVRCKHCRALPPGIDGSPFRRFCTMMDTIRGRLGRPLVVSPVPVQRASH